MLSAFADKAQTDCRLSLFEQSIVSQAGKERGIGVIGSLIIGVCLILSSIIADLSFCSRLRAIDP